MNKEKRLWGELRLLGQGIFAISLLFVFAYLGINDRWLTVVQPSQLYARDDAPLVTCLALAAPAAIPAPSLITFDDLAVDTVIGESYKPSFGVAFENNALKQTKVMTFTDGINTTNVAVSVITPSPTNEDRRLFITFDTAKSHVGLLVGNGVPVVGASGVIATLIAYDAQGGEICRVSKGPVSATTLAPFIGLRDPFGKIRAIAIDYSPSTQAVMIDDLRFTYDAQSITPTPTNTPTATNTATPTATRTPTPTRTPFPLVAPTVKPYQDLPLQQKELPFFVNDLAIWGVEVTQGMQCYDTNNGLTDCPNNSLGLAARKKTVVRVYPRYIGQITDAEVPVTILVELCVNDTPMSQSCYGDYNEGIATTKFQRDRVDLSAEFSFYAAVGGNAPLPVLVRAEIDPNNGHKEQDETNNRFPLNGPSHFTVNFYDNEPVTIIGKRIRYKEDGKEYKAQGPSLEGQAADWFQHILPLADDGLQYKLASGFIDIGSPFVPQTLFDEDPAPDHLSYIEYQISKDEALNETEGLRYYYGWIPNTAYPGAGLASTAAIFTGMGTDLGTLAAPADATWATKVFAHELMHVWQLGHIGLADSCGAYEEPGGYYLDFKPPYANSSIQELWFSPYSYKVRTPSNTHDLMSYCGVRGQSGISYARLSPFSWNFALNKFRVKGQGQQSGTNNPDRTLTDNRFQITNADQVLAVRVAITNPHEALGGYFEDMVRLDTNRVLAPLFAQGDYAVQLRVGDTPVYTQSFGVSFAPHTHTVTSTIAAALAPLGPVHEGELARSHSHFIIPWMEGADTVVLLYQKQVLDQRTISKNAPVVAITSPSVPQSWPAGSQQTITWQGSDEDGDALTYTLQYNRDGTYWESVGVGITNTSYLLDVADYAGGAATQFRVLASDGLLSALSAPSVPITLPNHLPTIGISEPFSGTVRPPGASVLFGAYAFDREDGLLTNDAAYQWVSDRQGVVGNGRDFFVNDLQTGWHTITLTVADQAGQQATQQVRLLVGHQLFLPLVTR